LQNDILPAYVIQREKANADEKARYKREMESYVPPPTEVSNDGDEDSDSGGEGEEETIAVEVKEPKAKKPRRKKKDPNAPKVRIICRVLDDQSSLLFLCVSFVCNFAEAPQCVAALYQRRLSQADFGRASGGYFLQGVDGHNGMHLPM